MIRPSFLSFKVEGKLSERHRHLFPHRSILSDIREEDIEEEIIYKPEISLISKLPVDKSARSESVLLTPLDRKMPTLHNFLLSLSKHKNSYLLFLEEAKRRKIISIRSVSHSEYYLKYMNISRRKRSLLVPPVINKVPIRASSEVPRHVPPIFPASNDINLSHIVENSSRPTSRSSFSGSRVSSRMSTRSFLPLKKQHLIDRQDPKIVKSFLEICGSSHLRSARVTQALFKKHLYKRYPKEMAKIMNTFMEFTSSNLEEYCVQLEKFIKTPHKKLLRLSFQLFDHNRDRYICYEDIYKAVENKKIDSFDEDLCKINLMFEKKKQRKTRVEERRKRNKRKTSRSIASELSDEEKKKQKLPYIHPEKPEALTFRDFCNIDFQGRPQIIVDFIMFISRFDLKKFRTKRKPALLQRIPSENTIYDMRLNPQDYPNITEDPKYPHLLKLEERLAMFEREMRDDLLRKFRHLQDNNNNTIAVISKKSMIEKWPSLFGTNCEYVTERFYHFFAGKKYLDVTKTRFLKVIHPFVHGNLEYYKRKLAFFLFDTRHDGIVTVDEFYRLFESLPPGSPIYEECLVLAKEFESDIFEKRFRKLEPIDFLSFSKYFPEPLFAKELIRVINTPFDVLLGEKNESFFPGEFSEVDEQSRRSTIALMKMSYFKNKH